MSTTQQDATQGAQSFSITSLLGSKLSATPAFQIAWTAVRVGVGLLMIHNGFSKLADVSGFATGVIQFMGFPYPVFLTYCAAYTEIVGSILLAVGALTRLSATALLFTMVVAVYFHLRKTGIQLPPLETASLYGLSFLLFVVGGGGQLSVDRFLLQILRKAD